MKVGSAIASMDLGRLTFGSVAMLIGLSRSNRSVSSSPRFDGATAGEEPACEPLQHRPRDRDTKVAASRRPTDPVLPAMTTLM
jgi:hypothetical protein